MTGRIVNVTASAGEIVPIGDMKAHLRVTHGLEDELIAAYTAAAVASIGIKGELGLALGEQSISESLQHPDRDTYLSILPAQSLVGVSYFDEDNTEQTADLADFEFYKSDDWAFVRSGAWPATYDRPDAVTINYTAGVDGVEADILHAIKLIVGHWYHNREDASEESLKEIPRAASHLLGLHRVGWYG